MCKVIPKDNKYNLQITLLLIRETFKIIYYSNNVRTTYTEKVSPISSMCQKLSISPKNYHNFITSNSNRMPDDIFRCCEELKNYGFPESVLSGEECLIIDVELEDVLRNYFDSLGDSYNKSFANDISKIDNEKKDYKEKKKKDREKFHEKFANNIHCISNPDGSSFLYCVFQLYNAVYYPDSDDGIMLIKNFLDNGYIKDLPNSPKKYPQSLVEDFYAFYDLDRKYNKPREKSHSKTSKKLPKISNTLKLKINLFLIREALIIYLKIDNIPVNDGLTDFYRFLDTSKKIYDNAIDRDNTKPIYFLDNLIQCGFPKYLFRKDSPTLLPMSDGIKQAVIRYYDNKDNIETFREKFYTEFVYKISSDNALMAHIATTLLDNIQKE